MQTCDNINGCNKLFDDSVYSSLDTCHSAIRGSRDENYMEFWSHTEDGAYLILMIYMFNIVIEYEDIY